MGDLHRVNQQPNNNNLPNLDGIPEHTTENKPGLSYSDENTTSHKERNSVSDSNKRIPDIPRPAPSNVQGAGGSFEMAKQGLKDAFDGVESRLQQSNPDILDQQVKDSLNDIKSAIDQLTANDQEKGQQLQLSLSSLLQSASNPSLTSDELTTILIQIKTKLGDNQQRVREEEIKDKAQDRIKQSENRLENAKEQTEKKSGFEGLPLGKKIDFVLLSIFVPPVGLWELGNLAAREANGGKDTGLSLLSENKDGRINFDAMTDPDYIGNKVYGLGERLGVLPKRPDNERETKEQTAQRLSNTGLGIAGFSDVEGMSRIEMIKMLQEAHDEAEEVKKKQKLIEAIQAIEAGRPDEAVNILASYEGTEGLSNQLSLKMQEAFDKVKQETDQFQQDRNEQQGEIQKKNSV